MKFPGIIGPSYTLDSLNAECQRTINWYVEAIESQQGKNVFRLVRTPGRQIFASLPGGASRGLYQSKGRVWAAIGSTLYELMSDGTYISRGTIGGSGPVSMASNGVQLAVTAGGTLYCLDLTTNALTTPGVSAESCVTFSDGYFVALDPNSQTFRISGINDGTTWDPLDFGAAEGSPDNALSIMADHRELWVFGEESIEVFYDSGDLDFPFQRISGAFIEQGSGAANAPAKVDNSIFWIGSSTRGGRVAWRANGYTPVRVSTHAVEQAWAQYATVADAVGHSYEENGHAFWQLTFPSAKATWTLDCATNTWHERGVWDKTLGQYGADRGVYHAYAFGKHLAADGITGNVYEQGMSLLDDAGEPIRRLRRAPHIANEMVRMTHSSLWIDAQVGIGIPSVAAGTLGADPQMMLRWSNDGGRTWSSEHWKSAGKVGEYTWRAWWKRLGMARDRVYELVVTDPVDWSIVNAYLEVEAGWS